MMLKKGYMEMVENFYLETQKSVLGCSVSYYSYGKTQKVSPWVYILQRVFSLDLFIREGDIIGITKK